MTHEEAKKQGFTHYMVKGGKKNYLTRCDNPTLMTHIIAITFRIKAL